MKLIVTVCLLLLASASSYAQLPWERFTPADHTFSILFPTTPRQRHNKDKKAGTLENLYMANTAQGKYLFIAGTTDYKKGLALNDTAELKANKENFCATAKLELLHSNAIKCMNKYPGIAFTCKDATTFYTCHVYIVSSRVYMIVAGAPGMNTTNPEVEKFLSSFKLLQKNKTTGR